MFVQHLSLRQFRNYAQADVIFEPGLTVILGPNGQGKTNLIESLVFLAQGSSHRVSSREALIHKDQGSGVIRARLVSGDRALTCEVQLNRGSADRTQINGNVSRLGDVADVLSVVLFAPEDLTLIRGEPHIRRQYIDAIAGWLNPRVRGILADYERTLKQRNTLLKSLNARRREVTDLSTLDIWDESLCKLGAQIHEARLHAIAILDPHVSARYSVIAEANHGASLRLLSSVEDVTENIASDETADSLPSADVNRDEARLVDHDDDGRPAATAYERMFHEKLVSRRSADIERGQTSVGPHRDDVQFFLNGLPTKGYASHGESWSFVLSLRLAELDMKREHGTMGDPIVILDDVYAELDQGRRRRLEQSLTTVEQVLVTAAVDEDVPRLPAGHMLRVVNGVVIDPDSSVTHTKQGGDADVDQ